MGERSEVWTGPLHSPPGGIWPIWSQASLGWWQRIISFWWQPLPMTDVTLVFPTFQRHEAKQCILAITSATFWVPARLYGFFLKSHKPPDLLLFCQWQDGKMWRILCIPKPYVMFIKTQEYLGRRGKGKGVCESISLGAVREVSVS